MHNFINKKFRAESLVDSNVYKDVLDVVNRCVIVLSLDKKVIYTNKQACFKGKSDEVSLVGKDVFEVFSFLNTDPIRTIFERVEKYREEEKILGYRRQSEFKTDVFLDIYLYSVVNSMDKLMGYVLLIGQADVNKKFLQGNYKTNVFIRYVVNAMIEGATIIDSNGKLEYANQRFYEMLGYKPSEMIGKHWMSWSYEGDLEKIEDEFSIKNRQKHGNVFIYRLRFKKKNGDLLPVMMSVTKNIDSDFDIKAIGVIVDVSEQLRLETEYKEITEINRRILETISTSIITIDKDLRIKFINNQVEQTFGKKMDEVRGKMIRDIYPDLQVMEEWSSWVLRSLKPYQVDRYKFCLEDNERYIFLNIRIHPFYDRNNHINGVVCAFDDVSMSAKLEEQIELSFRKLEITHTKLNDLLKRQRDFLADVSHELRTPLTIMSGNIEILKNNKEAQIEDYQEVLDIVGNELDKMTVMVKDLTTLIKMEEGKLQLNCENFNFSIVTKEMFSRLEGLNLGTRNIHLSMDEDYEVYADKERLSAMLWNLVENALKYSGDQAMVLVKVGARDNNLLLEVEDNGIGIPEDEKEYIFDRFYRVDKARSREKGGSGLGLAIVKWIIEAHKGEIELTSEIDKGTKFKILLPILRK
jgi:PAS domain S-box-containing protein